MPYQTKADCERENWMTLPEAVTHIISAADGCDEPAARRQLIAALADGLRVLGPLKWERERGDRPPPFGTTSIVTPTDTPPLGHAWLGAKIRWKTGRVRDDWGEYKNGKWRVLLIRRHTVARYWQPSPPSEPTAPVGPAISNANAADVVVPFARRRPGPKTRKGKSIIDAMKEDIRANELTVEALRAMSDKKLLSKYGEKFDAARTACREARDNAVAELDGNSNSVK